MFFSRAGRQHQAGLLVSFGQDLPNTHTVPAREEWRMIKRADHALPSGTHKTGWRNA